jgi:hypothetical protein
MPLGASRYCPLRLRDLAWGGAFAALLAPPMSYGLALEEIAVRSRLGQPLDAVVAVRSAPGEALAAGCFSVTPPGEGGLPGIDGIRLHLDRATGLLRLRSTYPVLEPLNELKLRVRCDGMPSLERTFLVVLDPPDVLAESVFARTPTQAQPALAGVVEPFAPAASVDTTTPRPGAGYAPPPRAAAAERVPQPAEGASPPAEGAWRPARAAPVAPGTAIAPGSEYFVVAGDTLSSVAARVSNRPAGSLWQVAERIHALNPLAFLGNDPDQLIAGVAIAIPALEGDAGVRLHVASSVQPRAPVVRAAPVLATRESVLPQPTRSFVMSTTLTSDSMEKLQLRRLGFMQAANAATARIAASRGETPEAPVRTQADTTAVLRTNDEEAGGATDASATAEAVATPAANAAEAQPAPADEEPRAGGVSWTLAALLGGLLGAILTRFFLYRRYRSQLESAQNARRGSGLEHTIRLDHGIIVDEHRAQSGVRAAPATAPRFVAVAPVGDAHASALDDGPVAAARLDLIDLPAEMREDPTVRIESPMASLDLELPVMPELATPDAGGAQADTADTAIDSLADSRQFAVDTDLLALAYVEDLPDAPVDDTIVLESPEPSESEEPRQAAPGDGSDDAYYHLEATSVDDTTLTCELGDESKVLALWDLALEEEAPAAEADTRKRGGTKRR